MINNQHLHDMYTHDSLNIKPYKIAAVVAVIYLLLGIAYIYVSGRTVHILSQTSFDLVKYELYKGVGYFAVSSLALFMLCLWFLKKAQAREQSLAEHRSMMIAADRKAMAGVFASSVAHDMNNVIMIMDYATDELDNSCPSECNKDIRSIRRGVSDLKTLADTLRSVSRYDNLQSIENFDLVEEIHKTIEMARLHQKLKFCEITYDSKKKILFRGQPSLINQSILNMLLNAGDATHYRGNILISLEEDAGGVVIKVHDNGVGIEESKRDLVMEPLYTTKIDGSGLGLLSLQACAKVHHGSTQITDSHLGGACIELHLQNLFTETPEPPQMDMNSEMSNVTSVVNSEDHD